MRLSDLTREVILEMENQTNNIDSKGFYDIADVDHANKRVYVKKISPGKSIAKHAIGFSAVGGLGGGMYGFGKGTDTAIKHELSGKNYSEMDIAKDAGIGAAKGVGIGAAIGSGIGAARLFFKRRKVNKILDKYRQLGYDVHELKDVPDIK